MFSRLFFFHISLGHSQALKDVDYVVKEKTIIEKLLDCEINPNVSDTRGVFYFDNGHSFDRTLFYGNENDIFIFEIILFMLLLITTENIFIALISIGIVFEVRRLFLIFFYGDSVTK